jgi:hypothetical protein
VLECRCAQQLAQFPIRTGDPVEPLTPPNWQPWTPQKPWTVIGGATDWPVTTSVVKLGNLGPNVWRTFTAGNGEAH